MHLSPKECLSRRQSGLGDSQSANVGCPRGTRSSRAAPITHGHGAALPRCLVSKQSSVQQSHSVLCTPGMGRQVCSCPKRVGVKRLGVPLPLAVCPCAPWRCLPRVSPAQGAPWSCAFGGPAWIHSALTAAGRAGAPCYRHLAGKASRSGKSLRC